MNELKKDQGEFAGIAATDLLPLTQKYLRDTAELIKNLKALGGITELEDKIDKVSIDLKELRSDLNGLGGRITKEAGRIDTAEKIFGLFLGAAGLFLAAIGVILTIFGQPIVSYILAHYRITSIP
jgi:hypothetical protein